MDRLPRAAKTVSNERETSVTLNRGAIIIVDAGIWPGASVRCPFVRYGGLPGAVVDRGVWTFAVEQ